MSEERTEGSAKVRRVLVVDDDPALRDLVERTLKRAGFEAATVSCGADAVERAAADPGLVLLLDQKLPDMSGREIVTALSARGLQVPFVMMTGQGDERLAVDMMKLGAADYLLKDVDMVDRLPAILDRVFRGIETERRLHTAEEALRESERRFRAIFRDIPSVSVQGYSSEGTVRYWNRASETLYGFSEAEALGRNLVDLIIPPELRDAVAADVRNMVETSQALAPAEMTLMRKDGSRVPVLTHHVVVHTAGEPELFCIDVDLSELKRVELERERLTQAIEQSGETVVITDGEGRILYANPTFEQITGYARSEALGQSLQMLRSGRHDDAFYREMWETVRSGKVWKGEIVNRRKDGALFTEQATLSPVRDPSGKIVHFVAVKRDVTEQKRTAEMLVQSQKMEAIGRLAGGVAHDFNNMLAVIMGNTEMALDELEPGHSLRADLQEVHKAAARSADLTRQLLAFARKQTAVPKMLDLNETVAGMLKMLRRLIGENVALEWRPGPDLGFVRMDPSQIDQILVNLCVNARDAVRSTGTIAISTDFAALDAAACAELAGAVPGDYVRLAVADDGCGMDAETASHVFEPFFTTKSLGQGTGLGLATVYGIVKQNGGFIYLSSEVGKGTAFEVYLPRHRSKPEKASSEESTAPPMRGHETVLLVEDEPAILRMVQSLLERRGFHVLPAGGPGEALRLAEAHPGEIDLLITDVIMPEMNGRDLARTLLAQYPGLRRLFMSGHSADVLADHGVMDGDVHFIQKPFTLKDMQTRIADALAK
jgi:two-component system, cell cycle sensor histidine kinase and response regulator CckA